MKEVEFPISIDDADIPSPDHANTQVFLGAISALAVMTVLSALLGFVVTTFIPREYTYYTCTAIMFLFGIKVRTVYLTVRSHTCPFRCCTKPGG